MFNGLSINPAYTGMRECLSVLGLHSSQWVGFDGAPTSDYLTLHTPLNNKHAIGLNLFNDRLGVQNQTGIFPSYAYHLKIAKKQKLSFGVSAGVNFFTVQNSHVSTLTEDKVFAENKKTSSLPNIGAGLYYSSSRFYAGFSIPTLFSSEFSNVAAYSAFHMNPKGINLIFTSGGIVKLKNNLVWKPSILIKAITAGIFQMDLNSNVYFNEKLNIGASYRIKDAIVGMLGYRFTEQFDVAYSYAFPLSTIVRASSGSHEILLRFELRKKVETFNPRYF